MFEDRSPNLLVSISTADLSNNLLQLEPVVQVISKDIRRPARTSGQSHMVLPFLNTVCVTKASDGPHHSQLVSYSTLSSASTSTSVSSNSAGACSCCCTALRRS